MHSRTTLPLWTHFLHIGTLIGLSVAQPIFDLLGQQPQFLVSHHAGLPEIFCLLFLLVLLIPAVITGGAYLLDQFLGTQGWLRAAAIGPFAFLLVFLLGRFLFFRDPATRETLLLGEILLLASAGLLTLVSVFVYHRSTTARLYLTFLSPAILIMPILFLIQPSVQWIFAADRPRGPAQIKEPPDVPIVMVVFDELSLQSLLDRRGEIDSEHFPNFADLASRATWYRNTTTVSPSTRLALPAILTGNISKGNHTTTLPILAKYPDNLFLWLGGSHRLNVFESTSYLCPPDWLGRTVAPSRKIRGFLRGLLIVYLHRTLPVGLTARLPDIRHGWTVPDESRRLISHPVRQFESFLAAIPDAPGPSLNFIHVQMPHVPWIYLPSGRRYFSKGHLGLFTNAGVWKRSEALVTVAFQRYLLQVGFADRLLGQLLRKLRANRLYDRSLIIVVSDHGVSFRPGGDRRDLDEVNHKDILNVPLLIKAPYQKRGQVSDRPTRTIDILPSIADILGLSSPWPTDGISVTETDLTENRDLITTVPPIRFLRSRTTVCLEGRAVDVSNDGSGVRLDVVKEDGNKIIFFGWAADLNASELADSILIFADEELIYRGMPRYPRRDVHGIFPTANLEDSGFLIELDRRLFAGRSRVRCFASFGSRIQEASYYPIGFPWSLEPNPGWDDTNSSNFDCAGSLDQNATRSFLVTRPLDLDSLVSPTAFMAGLRQLSWNRGEDGLFKFGPTDRLLGKRLGQVSIIDSPGLLIRLAEPGLYEKVQLDSHFVPAGIEGWVSAKDVDFVAVAVNGSIRAVAPTFNSPSGERHFQAIVPESSFVNGSNQIRVFAVVQTDGEIVLQWGL